MFQPVGGIDMIGKAFTKEVGDLITYNAKVTKIAQDEKGVTVSYEDSKSREPCSRPARTGASAPFH